MATKVKNEEESLEVLSAEVIKKIDQEIDQSLVKENITDKLIAKLKEEYLPLMINGQADKEGYVRVQEARKRCKSFRVLGSKICKAGRAKANAEAQMWVAKEKQVTGAIREVEDYLEKQENEYEAERDRLAAERASKLEQQYANRIRELMGLGASLNGSNWVLDEVSFELGMVKEGNEEIWGEIKAAFKIKFDEKEQEREMERLRLEKEKKQMEEFRRQRSSFRVSQLKQVGFTLTSDGFMEGFGMHYLPGQLQSLVEAETEDWDVQFERLNIQISSFKEREEKEQIKREKDIADENRVRDRVVQLEKIWWNSLCKPEWDTTTILFTKEELINLSDDEFATRKDAHNKEVALRDEQEQKLQEQARQEQIKNAEDITRGKERRKILSSVNHSSPLTDSELGRLSDDMWNRRYMEAKNTYDEAEAEKERLKREQQLNESSDKKKWEEVVKYLKACPMPEMKSGPYRSKMKIAKDFLADL